MMATRLPVLEGLQGSGHRPSASSPSRLKVPSSRPSLCVVIGSSLIEQELTSPYALPYNAAQRPSGLLCVCRGDEGAERPRPGLPRPAAPPCSPLRCSGSVFRFVCSWVVLTPGYDFTCVPFNLSFYRWRHGHVLSRLEILTPAPGECTLESRSPLACPTSSPPVTGRLRSGGASNR